MMAFAKISLEEKRQKKYDAFLTLCQKNEVTLEKVVSLGAKLMKGAKLHHHFFKDYSWQATACALAEYALKKPVPPHQVLSFEEVLLIFSLFEKRIAQRLPVEYITQEAQYCGHTFYVNEHVLIPRSLMTARFEAFLKKPVWESYRVLDLCTGSGCIGITLALLNPKITVDLADISSEALKVANINIQKHALQERVSCIQSDGFNNIRHQYDLIITNPPYVSLKEYEASPEEFKQEPKIALQSGIEGLDLVHRILKQAKHYLSSKGILIAEIGPPAAKRLKKQYPQINFTWFKYKRPNGRELFFSTPGVFLCEKEDLQSV